MLLMSDILVHHVPILAELLTESPRGSVRLVLDVVDKRSEYVDLLQRVSYMMIANDILMLV